MPCFNDVEIVKLPADFRNVVEFRIYLDNVDEIISLYNKVSEIPEYVRMTPILFRLWQDWVEIYNEEQNNIDMRTDKIPNSSIRAMGERIAPSWLRYEFDSYEEFYKYYCELLGVES